MADQAVTPIALKGKKIQTNPFVDLSMTTVGAGDAATWNAIGQNDIVIALAAAGTGNIQGYADPKHHRVGVYNASHAGGITLRVYGPVPDVGFNDAGSPPKKRFNVVTSSTDVAVIRLARQ